MCNLVPLIQVLFFLFNEKQSKIFKCTKIIRKKEKKKGGKKTSTNRQDESVQKHVNRTKAAAKSGETKPTGTKPTTMSQGRSGGGDYYKSPHGYSSGGAGSYAYTSSSTSMMRTYPGTGRVNPLYRPDKHPDAVLGQSAAAAKIQTSTMYTHGQTKGYDSNVPGIGYTDFSNRGQYDVLSSSRYGDYRYPQDQGVGDPGASYRDRYYPPESSGAIQPSVLDTSSGRYSLRSGNTQMQTHTQTIHAPMDVDDPGQRSPNRNDYRNQPMETEYQASYRQGSNQLAPVHTHPLDQNPYPPTHKSYGEERHHEEHVYDTGSAYLTDRYREEELRKNQEWEHFDPREDEHRGIHTDPSDEQRHSTRDDYSDHRHAGKGFQQQTEEEREKVANHRQRTQSESESRRTTQTETDQGLRQNRLIHSEFNVRPQRQVSGDFHSFKNKESFIYNTCEPEHGTEPTVYIAHLEETSSDPENKVKKVEFGKKKLIMSRKSCHARRFNWCRQIYHDQRRGELHVRN